MNSTTHTRILKMAQLAILIAIMVLFAFTPLGFLKLGPIEITLLCFPVAIGAIVLGPLAGAILGGVFGILSFIQCFGMSVFGAFVLSLNPVLTFITCLVPRILCGWLSGLLFNVMQKIDKTRVISYFVAALSTALLNTVFFISCILMFFWGNGSFISTMESWGLTTSSVWIFMVAFVGLNGVVEAIVNFIAAGTVAKILDKFVNHRFVKSAKETKADA